MQMEYILGAGSLVQIIYILCDDMCIKTLFQINQCLMPRIRLYLLQLLPSGPVEIKHQLPVFCPGGRGGHILDAMIFPQTVAVSKSPDARFGAYSGTCQYDYFLFHMIKLWCN